MRKDPKILSPCNLINKLIRNEIANYFPKFSIDLLLRASGARIRYSEDKKNKKQWRRRFLQILLFPVLLQ